MARTVSVKLMADVAHFTRNIGGNAVGAVKSLSSELDKAAQAGRLDGVIASAGGAGLALAGMAGYAVNAAKDFEKAMSGVKAATHAGASDMNRLKEAALDAGRSSQYSATEAAGAITELSKAGVATADILGGGLKGALDLAAAGQLDVAEAAETAASALTQFKLQGKDVPHVADLLAAAAGKAQGSVHDMGMALNQAGLVSAQTGLSIEDTVGSLAAFASAGLTGSDAGTSFKQMLLMLQAPSGATKELMEELGVSAYDASGQFIGITALAGQLKAQLGRLTPEVRANAMAQIFGADAVRGASILYEQGAEGIQQWIDKTNDAGYAAETARIQTDNLAGDLERLKGSLETLAIESGSGANQGLRKLAQGANTAVDAFSDLPGWVQQTITVLSAVGGVSLLAGAGFLKARGTARELMDQLSDMGPRGAAAASGLSRLAGIAGKLGLAGAAAVGVYQGFKLFSDWAAERTGPTKANIDKLTESVQQFAATGKVTGELASKYGDSLQKIGQDVDAVTKGMKDLDRARADVAAGLSDPSVYENWNPVDPQVVQRLKDLDVALASLVKNGGASQARIMLDRLAASGRLTGDQYQRLIGQLPQYVAATASATIANSGLAKGFGDAKTNAQTLTGGLESAIEAGEKLTDVWNQLHGALLGTDKAMLAANTSIADVKKSFQENGRAVEGNTTAALKNRVAVGEAAKAAVEAAQAKYEETGSVGKANQIYNSYITQLRKTLTQSGLTKKQVDNLIGAYGNMPRSVMTNVDIKGEEGVNRALDKLLVKQYALAKGLSPTSAAASVRKDLDLNKKYGLAAGGPVRGAGTATSDSIPAWLSNGEHVWTAAEVAALGGQGAVAQLRAAVMSGKRVEIGDDAPGFARGGAVSWPFPTTASKTRIPSLADVLAAVIPAGPGGGATGAWMKNLLESRFGVSMISGPRPGARTLSGNASYHGADPYRAVDFPAIKSMARFMYENYKPRLKEAITPWQQYNVHNGSSHRYTGAVWNQHNFAGGNAHNHFAMANGGVINEPVFGYGLNSGSSYSFGERGAETVTPGVYGPGGGNTTIINLSPVLAAGANPAEHARQIAQYLELHFARGGEIRVNGQKLVGLS